MAYSKSGDPIEERWGDLPYFIAVAEEGSIKRAAKALGVTQSAVSKRLDSLERWLGGHAFDRNTSGTTLTYQGERMLQHVMAAQKSIQLARRDAKDAEIRVEGDCSLLVSDGVANFWMAQFLPRFFELYPNIELKMVLDNDLSASRQDVFDLRLHYYDPESLDNITRTLATVHFMLFASKSYLKMHGTPLTRDDLAQHRAVDLAIYLTRAASWSSWFNTDIVKNISLFTNQSAFLSRCVHEGVGIGLMPTYMVLRDPDVVALPLDIHLPGKLYVSYNRERSLKPAVKSTLSFIRETMFRLDTMPWFAEEFEVPQPEWQSAHKAWMAQI